VPGFEFWILFRFFYYSGVNLERRVVITGLGIVSPVGNDVDTAWDNVINGRSGIGRITRFDPADFNSHIAGEVKEFDVTAYIPAKEARQMDTFIHYGIAAGVQAWRDSGIEVTEENAERLGVIVGSGIGGLQRIEQTQKEYLERGARRISPFFVPASLINLVSGQLSIMLGLKGPSYAVVSACTTGLHSIGDAGRLIEYGDADVMMAGGTEATVSPLGIGGFAAMRALSTRNDDPTTASRPWDVDRDGFVLGEVLGFCARRIRACQAPRRQDLWRASGLWLELRCVPHHRTGPRRSPSWH